MVLFAKNTGFENSLISLWRLRKLASPLNWYFSQITLTNRIYLHITSRLNNTVYGKLEAPRSLYSAPGYNNNISQ